jgi:hypothetical protein
MTIEMHDLLLYPLILLCAWIIALIVPDTGHRRYAVWLAFPAAFAAVQLLNWLDVAVLNIAMLGTGSRPLDSLIYVGLPVIITFAAFFRLRDSLAPNSPNTTDPT